ncbi:hypothetical protein L5515_001346 [Caenorhabditis briggsae]|uniref:Transmembrane protein 234 homolog n=1 Tax=Caenorhabditis briggsae TaxID=6238 RepID=A0AAE9E4M2_CAEBR|nr:hypothetical protein L5515_001346 [Caenorhabditis briggsae]
MSECGVECIVSIIVVGFLWGATNPLLRYASRTQDSQMVPEENEGFAKIVGRFLRSFLNWKFSIPFAVNQLGSIMFNLLVINFPVTVVVPCVNAIQFIATFIVGISMVFYTTFKWNSSRSASEDLRGATASCQSNPTRQERRTTLGSGSESLRNSPRLLSIHCLLIDSLHLPPSHYYCS